MRNYFILSVFFTFFTNFVNGQNMVLNLDLRFPMQHNDTLYDNSGFGNHAIRNAGRSSVIYNNSLNATYFNGNSLYSFISSNLNFNENFTVYFDFIPETFCVTQNVCDWNSVLARRLNNNDPWNLVSFDFQPTQNLNAPRYITFNASNASPGSLRTARSSFMFNPNQNYKLVGVKMGCMLGIYVNCVLDTVVNISWGVGECNQPILPQPWLIGGNSHPNQFFKGHIKEIKMFDYALDQIQINNICNALSTSNQLERLQIAKFINEYNTLIFEKTVENLTIYDVSGRVVFRGENATQFDLNNLNNGVYIASYSYLGKLNPYKFIKY